MTETETTYPTEEEVMQRRARWKEALLSGEYTQTQGTLCRLKPEVDAIEEVVHPAGHCCLGVAIDVAIKDGLEVEEASQEYLDEIGDKGMEDRKFYKDKRTNSFSDAVEFATSNYLPRNVADYYGLVEQNPVIPEPTNESKRTLASSNDTGSTFAEIAQDIDTLPVAG